jgi:hypothetical protein
VINHFSTARNIDSDEGCDDIALRRYAQTGVKQYCIVFYYMLDLKHAAVVANIHHTL